MWVRWASQLLVERPPQELSDQTLPPAENPDHGSCGCAVRDGICESKRRYLFREEWGGVEAEDEMGLLVVSDPGAQCSPHLPHTLTPHCHTIARLQELKQYVKSLLLSASKSANSWTV